MICNQMHYIGRKIKNCSEHPNERKQSRVGFAAPKAWLAVAVVLVTLPVHATVYYVDVAQGSDSNNGTSTSLAWAHLPGSVGFTGSGWAALQNGDMVLVKGGSINSVRVEFTPTYYQGSKAFDSIVIRSGHLHSTPWGTGRAVIDGGNSRTAGVAFSGAITGPLWGVTFDGFELRNIAAGAAGPGYDDQTGSSCILAGSANYPAHFLTIKRCYLHDAARTVDNTGHGIEFSGYSTNFIIALNQIGPNIGTKGCETYKASFGVVSSNFFNGSGDHSLALSDSTHVDACNNLIYYIPPQVHEPAYGIQIATCSYCDVWNNVVYRPTPVSTTAGYDWSMGIGCYAGGTGNRIVNNTVAFFGNYSSGNGSTAMRVLDAGSTDQGLILQNNLVYNCFNVEGASYTVWTGYASGEKVTYNCFYSTLATTVMSYQVTAGGTSYPATVANFALNTATGRTYANNVQLDPLLTGGSLPTAMDANYRPNSAYFKPTTTASPLILATHNPLYGDAVHGYSSAPGKFGTDIVGVSRSAWSMGAYEVGGVQSPTAPTGLHIVQTGP